uniref:Zinc_ribbon_16 domain-containing protein n=1 Tax=Meloidogyne hapla TaxID=6305 RepID=A0A1I8C3V9_MELHA
MLPAVKWLNSNTNKLFVLDQDMFSLCRVVEDKNDFNSLHGDTNRLNIKQLNTCAVARQEQDTLRTFALDHSPDSYLALGYSTGRISIFSAENDQTLRRARDINDISKSISCMQWSYVDTNRICVAYERGRGPDYSVIVYDLYKLLRQHPREQCVSIFELNLAEKIAGISWLKDEPNLLLISGSRGLRIADIREHGNFQSVLGVQTSLMGVCSEPTAGHLFACHSRNYLYIYDRRYLNYSPVHAIEACSSNKIINKISWHPKRSFNISLIAKDSGNFYSFSISKNAFIQQDKCEVINECTTQQKNNNNSNNNNNTSPRSEMAGYAYGSRLFYVPGIPKLGSFDWHPHIADSIVFLSSKFNMAELSKDLSIIKHREDVSTAIACDNEFALTTGRRLKFENGFQNIPPTEDKVKILKQRALDGYGYGNTLSCTQTLIDTSLKVIEKDKFADDDLRFCWHWIYSMFHSSDAGEMHKNYGTIFVGVRHILAGAKATSTIKHDEITFRNRLFINDSRLKVLRMCNWPNYSDREECKCVLDDLSASGHVEEIARVAAIALFCVQGMLCLEYLKEFNERVNSPEFIENREPEIVNSYQKMADIILNIFQRYDGVRVPGYENVCEELCDDVYLLAIVKNIRLEDKLAFAVLHMDDDFLNSALDKLTNELLVSRPLSALFIVGLEDDPGSHMVLHRYLDMTFDIQTVTLLLSIGNCFQGCRFINDSSLIGIKSSELLERAMLQKTFLCTFLRPDTHYDEADVRPNVANIQAVIACNFCGAPIYPSIASRIENLRTPKVISTFNRRMGSHSARTRTLSCICRKPLPKCIICRRSLGSQAEPEAEMELMNSSSIREKGSMIDHWFVWCALCSHGGHLSHIRDWFNEHSVCASSGCDCKCSLGEENSSCLT